MSGSRICPRCGGSDYHFDRNAGVFICRSCGSRFLSAAEREADDEFERNKALARAHLEVGNWYDAKKLILPYCSSRPADKELYLMLLLAVTKGYDDLLINDHPAVREAAEYWDKLSRLHSVNAVMRAYALKRKDYICGEKRLAEAKAGVAAGISMLLTFITVCMLFAGWGGSCFLVVLSIAAWVICIMLFEKSKYKSGYTDSYGEDNPFRM